jgi:hypothetical protein
LCFVCGGDSLAQRLLALLESLPQSGSRLHCKNNKYIIWRQDPQVE